MSTWAHCGATHPCRPQPNWRPNGCECGTQVANEHEDGPA